MILQQSIEEGSKLLGQPLYKSHLERLREVLVDEGETIISADGKSLLVSRDSEVGDIQVIVSEPYLFGDFLITSVRADNEMTGLPDQNMMMALLAENHIKPCGAWKLYATKANLVLSFEIKLLSPAVDYRVSPDELKMAIAGVDYVFSSAKMKYQF